MTKWTTQICACASIDIRSHTDLLCENSQCLRRFIFAYTFFNRIKKSREISTDVMEISKQWSKVAHDMQTFLPAAICVKLIVFYPVLCPKLTLIQPTWSAYPYHLVFLIWYPYSLVFLIWHPYAPTSLYGNTAHCSGYGVAMGCYGLFIVTRTGIVTS